MERFLKKAVIINLISGILFLGLGVILLTSPETILFGITYLIEIILIITGIVTIVNYVRVESKYDTFGFGFVQGIVCILLALFLIVNPKIITTILPICIGIWMVIGSVSRIQVAIKLSDWGEKASYWYILFSVVMFSLGIVILCNPFKTAALIVQMLGIGISAYSLLDIIQNVSIINFLNKIDE